MTGAVALDWVSCDDRTLPLDAPVLILLDEIISFPLYVEALKFAFHENNMIRVALRTLTLNVYHGSNADSTVPTAFVEDTVVQIEDTLYYFSDVMSPEQDMASIVAAALFYQPDFLDMKQGAPNVLSLSDKSSDEEYSEDNLVGEYDSYELDQETSNHPADDDFKTEVDISRKVLENLIKSSEKSEPSGNEGSDIDTKTEAEHNTSEKKQKQTNLPAAKLENSKSVAEEGSIVPASFSTITKLIFNLQIDRAQEDGSVVFHDGNSIIADVIMHCTGLQLRVCGPKPPKPTQGWAARRCFVKYATSEEAERAIRALHDQYTLPRAMSPIQVRFADGERECHGIESFSKHGDSIYFEEKGDTPVLNIIQYIPSTFNSKATGLTINQQLKPLCSLDMYLQVSLSISTKTDSQSATLNVRIPSWTFANGAKATLNDKDLGLISPVRMASPRESTFPLAVYARHASPSPTSPRGFNSAAIPSPPSADRRVSPRRAPPPPPLARRPCDLLFIHPQLCHRSEFGNVEAEIISKNKDLFPGTVTFDDFLWAFGILRSRVFSGLRGDKLALIPLADLVNHSDDIT
ncbi:hypothetical protein ABZP36_020822 [Zizania latifolia]